MDSKRIATGILVLLLVLLDRFVEDGSIGFAAQVQEVSQVIVASHQHTTSLENRSFLSNRHGRRRHHQLLPEINKRY